MSDTLNARSWSPFNDLNSQDQLSAVQQNPSRHASSYRSRPYLSLNPFIKSQNIWNPTYDAFSDTSSLLFSSRRASLPIGTFFDANLGSVQKAMPTSPFAMDTASDPVYEPRSTSTTPRSSTLSPSSSPSLVPSPSPSVPPFSYFASAIVPNRGLPVRKEFSGDDTPQPSKSAHCKAFEPDTPISSSFRGEPNGEYLQCTQLKDDDPRTIWGTFSNKTANLNGKGNDVDVAALTSMCLRLNDNTSVYLTDVNHLRSVIQQLPNLSLSADSRYLVMAKRNSDRPNSEPVGNALPNEKDGQSTMSGTVDGEQDEEEELTDEQKRDLIREIFESYFGDRRIWGLIQNLSSRAISPSGWCSIMPVTAFSKVTRITTSRDIVIAALRQSSMLQLSHDGSRVKRLDRPNLLSSIAAAKSWRNTVYMLGFPQDIRKSDLMEYFSSFGRISTITLCPSLIGAPTTVLAEFVDAEMAARCIRHGTHTFKGCQIEIVSRRTTKRRDSTRRASDPNRREKESREPKGS